MLDELFETLNLYISILVLHVLHGFYIPIESKTRPSSLPGNWTWPETCRIPAAFFMKFRCLIERIRDAPTTLYERIREILRFK